MYSQHKELCNLAVNWLRRPASRQGPGCTISISETTNWINGEIPDAIGWRPYRHTKCGSILVEVKVTRSDFLADMTKPHRAEASLGMGNYRYYMTPEGLIDPEEVPQRWGHVEVTSRGHLKVRRGHVLLEHEAPDIWRFDLINHVAEISTLAMCVNRVADPQKVQETIRDAMNRNARLQAEIEKLMARNVVLSNEVLKLRSQQESVITRGDMNAT